MSRNSCKGCEYSQKCELVKMTKEERKRREEIEELSGEDEEMTKKELDEKLGVIDREIKKIFEQFPILIDVKARNKVEDSPRTLVTLVM